MCVFFRTAGGPRLCPTQARSCRLQSNRLSLLDSRSINPFKTCQLPLLRIRHTILLSVLSLSLSVVYLSVSLSLSLSLSVSTLILSSCQVSNGYASLWRRVETTDTYFSTLGKILYIRNFCPAYTTFCLSLYLLCLFEARVSNCPTV